MPLPLSVKVWFTWVVSSLSLVGFVSIQRARSLGRLGISQWSPYGRAGTESTHRSNSGNSVFASGAGAPALLTKLPAEGPLEQVESVSGVESGVGIGEQAEHIDVLDPLDGDLAGVGADQNRVDPELAQLRISRERVAHLVVRVGGALLVLGGLDVVQRLPEVGRQRGHLVLLLAWSPGRPAPSRWSGTATPPGWGEARRRRAP